jgi:hypothetical protein
MLLFIHHLNSMYFGMGKKGKMKNNINKMMECSRDKNGNSWNIAMDSKKLS